MIGKMYVMKVFIKFDYLNSFVLLVNVYGFVIWDELNKNILKCVYLSFECFSFVGVEFLLSSIEWFLKNFNIVLFLEIFFLLNYLSV